MKIENTFKFKPATTHNFGYELMECAVRGSIIIEDDEVVLGQEIVEYISILNDRTYLVSKIAFDYLVKKGVKNVCMFDPSKTTYGSEGRTTAQGGLIFA